jgi:hypothetical protein
MSSLALLIRRENGCQCVSAGVDSLPVLNGWSPIRAVAHHFWGPLSGTSPQQLLRSLISDQSAEMAKHAELRMDTGLANYFCDLTGSPEKGPPGLSPLARTHRLRVRRHRGCQCGASHS